LIEGGGGIDTLQLLGNGDTLNLNNVSNLSGIEKIDLTGTGANNLALTMADIFNLGGDIDAFSADPSLGDAQLLIDGSVGDAVNLQGIILNDSSPLAATNSALTSAGYVIGTQLSIDGGLYTPITKNNITMLLDSDIYDPGGG